MDPLQTQRLLNALEALEKYVDDVAAPLANGTAQDELIKLRKENAQMKEKQTQAFEKLGQLIEHVEQKGLTF